VLLIMHTVMTLFVDDTALSALSTFVTMFMLWSFYFMASEFRGISPGNHDLHIMQSQINDSLIAMFSDTTSAIPRLRWRSDESKRRLSDVSLRESEFHADLVNMLDICIQGHVPSSRNLGGSVPSPPAKKFFSLPKVLSIATTTSARSVEVEVAPPADPQHGVASSTATSCDDLRERRLHADVPFSFEAVGPRVFEIISDRKVAVLAEANLGAKVMNYLAPGARFEVVEEHWVDGRRYLELSGGGGFVSEVSRKHSNKIVASEAVPSSSTASRVSKGCDVMVLCPAAQNSS